MLGRGARALSFLIGFAGDTVDHDEVFEDLADFAVAEDLNTTGIGHAMTEAAGKFNDFTEAAFGSEIAASVGEFEVLNH